MSAPKPNIEQDVLHRCSEIINPRLPSIRRAHAVHTGKGKDGYRFGGRFLCAWCGWASGWLSFDTQVEIRRGIACPDCNAGRGADTP